MSDETKSEPTGVPPRVTIKLPGQSGELPAGVGGKKKTTRISLDQVSAESGALPGAHVESVGVASKTIRLSPALSGQGAGLPVVRPTTGSGTEEGKRQTSRIPLESVFPSGAQSGIPGAVSSLPKTIKVKRPTIAVSPGVAFLKDSQPAPAVVETPAEAPSPKSQTARVEAIPEATSEAQPTQKKTIKIRRADEGSGAGEPRGVSIARSSGADASIPDKAPGQVARPHGAFVGMAAAALLVLCFMIYVLAGQAFPHLGWSM
jgi:hypothetical protein